MNNTQSHPNSHLDSKNDEIIWELKKTRKNIFLNLNFLWSVCLRFGIACFLSYIFYVCFDKMDILVHPSLINIVALLSLIVAIYYFLIGVVLSINIKTMQITNTNFILKKYIGSDIILPLGSFYICEEDETRKLSLDTIMVIRKLSTKAIFPRYIFLDFYNTNIQEIYEIQKPFISNALVQMNEKDYNCFKRDYFF